MMVAYSDGKMPNELSGEIYDLNKDNQCEISAEEDTGSKCACSNKTNSV